MVTVYLIYWLWITELGWIIGTVNQTTPCWTLFNTEYPRKGGICQWMKSLKTTIGINGFTMVFGLTNNWHQWFCNDQYSKRSEAFLPTDIMLGCCGLIRRDTKDTTVEQTCEYKPKVLKFSLKVFFCHIQTFSLSSNKTTTEVYVVFLVSSWLLQFLQSAVKWNFPQKNWGERGW